jgi:hypothetical protein
MLTLKFAQRWSAPASAATALILLIAAGPAHAVTTTTKTAVQFQDTGYRYLQVSPADPAGFEAPGFEAPGFDDSGWGTGQAGFGTSGGPCPLNDPTFVHTNWDLGTDMLVRKPFTLPATATGVRVDGTIDNNATVFVNGVQIGSAGSGNCETGSIAFLAPSAVGGANVLAVRGHDDGQVASYLDQRVTYDVPVYSLCLLYDPTKAAKLGSTIPLKIRLCDENGNNLSSSAITIHATGVSKLDSLVTGTVEDAGNANPDADFRYDAGLAGYIYNKTTKGLSSGTWRMTITVGGDSEAGYVLQFDVK